MTGYDLRLWRKSLGWTRDRAAEELGVCLRTYKDYENSDEVKRFIALATLALSTENLLDSMHQKKQQDSLFGILKHMHDASGAVHPGTDARWFTRYKKENEHTRYGGTTWPVLSISGNAYPKDRIPIERKSPRT